jgi:hypothetical protein
VQYRGVLGGFIGSDEFILRKLEEKSLDIVEDMASWMEMCDLSVSEDYLRTARKDLPMTQLKVQFVRYCIATLATYTVRTGNYKLTEQFAVDIDKEVAKCFMWAITSPDERFQPGEGEGDETPRGNEEAMNFVAALEGRELPKELSNPIKIILVIGSGERESHRKEQPWLLP